MQNLNPSEYLFEKFGKRGWLCEKCNNFNFASRTKCNRCGIKIRPKTLNNVKNENKNKTTPDKKEKLPQKKNLIKKIGDWICPNCTNINFAFRLECNRCGLSKQQAIIAYKQIELVNNNNIKESNNINNIQNIYKSFNNLNNSGFNNNNYLNNINQDIYNNNTLNNINTTNYNNYNQQINQDILKNQLLNAINSNNNNINNNDIYNNIAQIQKLIYLLNANNNGN
jgi:hypothetical protein